MKEESIGVELRELNIAILRHMAKNKPKTTKDSSKHTCAHGANGLQVWVIEYLSQHQDKDIFQKDLEKEFIMRRPTATNFLKKMEQFGLLRRESVAYDARLKKIILTDKALEMQEAMRHRTDEFENLLRGNLTQEEITAFIATVKKIKRNMGADNV
jgi:DNA-binding MarR family transcriptional regulator